MRSIAVPLIAVLIFSSVLLTSCTVSDDRTIEGTIHAYYDGLLKMDMDIIVSTIHPDSGLYDYYAESEFTDVFVESPSDDTYELGIGPMNITEQTERWTMVSVEVTGSIVENGERREKTETQIFEMRQHEDNWLIFNLDYPGLWNTD